MAASAIARYAVLLRDILCRSLKLLLLSWLVAVRPYAAALCSTGLLVQALTSASSRRSFSGGMTEIPRLSACRKNQREWRRLSVHTRQYACIQRDCMHPELIQTSNFGGGVIPAKRWAVSMSAAAGRANNAWVGSAAMEKWPSTMKGRQALSATAPLQGARLDTPKRLAGILATINVGHVSGRCPPGGAVLPWRWSEAVKTANCRIQKW